MVECMDDNKELVFYTLQPLKKSSNCQLFFDLHCVKRICKNLRSKLKFYDCYSLGCGECFLSLISYFSQQVQVSQHS